MPTYPNWRTFCPTLAAADNVGSPAQDPARRVSYFPADGLPAE